MAQIIKLGLKKPQKEEENVWVTETFSLGSFTKEWVHYASHHGIFF